MNYILYELERGIDYTSRNAINNTESTWYQSRRKFCQRYDTTWSVNKFAVSSEGVLTLIRALRVVILTIFKESKALA